MRSALTSQQSFAMVYARLSALRHDLGASEPRPLEQLCADFDRALEDLAIAGFDLASFKLGDGQEQVVDRGGWLRARLDAVLDYMDLFAGLP